MVKHFFILHGPFVIKAAVLFNFFFFYILSQISKLAYGVTVASMVQ